MRYTRFLVLGLVALAAAGGVPSPRPVFGATFNVNSTADAVDASPGNGVCATAGGQCTLRAAIQEANALVGLDTITVPHGTYTLAVIGQDEDTGARGDLDVRDDVIITGDGASTTAINGAGIDRVFDIAGVLFVSTISVDLNGVKILAGKATGNGGGINAWSASVTLANSSVEGNTADGYGGALFAGFSTVTLVDSSIVSNKSGSYGGGIAVLPAQLTLDRTIVSGNTADEFGGGIASAYISSDSVGIHGSTITGNTAGWAGGGIYNSGHSMTITESLIDDNVANGTVWPDMGGGGLYNDSSSTIDIIASQVINNTTYPAGSGGGILNRGDLTVRESSIGGNRYAPGGGILNLGTSTVENTTISDNNVGGGFEGGGIYSNGSLGVTNATIVGNTGVIGGGIYVSAGTALLTNVTVAGNTTQFAGYGAITAAGSTTLLNSIVASNSNGNCGWAILSGGHNLDSGNTCGFTAAGDLINTDPLLGPLANNGGLTQTHALLTGSPAIDAGDNTGCPATDQRGADRPLDGDQDGTATCDIGAYEYGDIDADGVPDASDNCPAWPNADQSLPPWTVPADDPDCDGFTDARETFLTTDPNNACAVDNGTSNEGLPDHWPFDFDDNQRAALADVMGYIPVFNSFDPDPPYDPRYDLNQSGGITLADVMLYIPVFNLTCVLPP
ncbi:MAG: choice-of-anchor Q domain-containing protein [Dehalococcoidia bacterium]|nr:choice-of-anchor Q domain-containing protein [Dehalococcoidia bacterium]